MEIKKKNQQSLSNMHKTSLGFLYAWLFILADKTSTTFFFSAFSDFYFILSVVILVTN